MIKKTCCSVAFCIALVLEANAQTKSRVDVAPGVYLELLSGYPNTNAGVFQSVDMIYYIIGGTSTNGVSVARLPREQAYLFNMQGENGNIVPKSTLGVENSNPLDEGTVAFQIKSKNPKLTDEQVCRRVAYKLRVKHHGLISSTLCDSSEVFRPDEYFLIPTNGTYLLHLQMRLWMQKTNGQFGVVTSPPLALKIVKRMSNQPPATTPHRRESTLRK
jgi:hypothetical protein